jgi:hypothetical protein
MEDIRKAIETLEGRVTLLEKEVYSRVGTVGVLKLRLTLPEDHIGGLYFNEQKVRAVFVLRKDGWYASRDILFLSARNTTDDNSRDLLAEYLSATRAGGREIRRQIAGALGLQASSIDLALPLGPQGVKTYNGVPCIYWHGSPRIGSVQHFYCCGRAGFADSLLADAVVGCAPMFQARRPDHTEIEESAG